MRLNYFILSLILFPLCVVGQTTNIMETMLFSDNSIEKNTIVKTFSNESEQTGLDTLSRTIDHPTQIIRLSSPLENSSINCQQVNDEIDKVFIKKITSDKFMYTTLVTCNFDPNTHLAQRFTLHSYFDPLNDEGVDFLKSYLAEYNGTNLLGTTLHIESAKGLIVALNLSAGTKKNPDNPPFIEFRNDHSTFYFDSNYEMKNKLFVDIKENFYSNDPDKVLPFLDRWLFTYAGEIYRSVLRDSNYVLLQPEQIFLMDNGEKIFISNIKRYFAHVCTPYENHRCLKQAS